MVLMFGGFCPGGVIRHYNIIGWCIFSSLPGLTNFIFFWLPGNLPIFNKTYQYLTLSN